MNIKKVLPILLTIIGAVSFFANAADDKFHLPPETTKLKPGPGAELATANCLLCHSADYISTQPPLTRAGWQAAIIKMQQKYGAPIATNNVDKLADYLAANYGKESSTNQAVKK